MSREHSEHPTHAVRASRRWRWATPSVLVLCGGLFATSAATSDGSDLRPDRYTDMASVVRGERAQADRLNDRASLLNEQVAELSAGLGDRGVNRYQTKIRTVSDPAGFTARSGEGVTVVLDDAPAEVTDTATGDPNDYVVHQQDIQALVNALWQGGASAVTLMGQRLVSTTGIKCEGNAVTLHGLPYSPPYEITAIGDPTALQQAVYTDDQVSIYRELADDPQVALGWSMAVEQYASAPAYKGVVTLKYATPLDG